MVKTKFIRGDAYYKYDSYNSWEDALADAKKFKKWKKNKYKIEQVERGFIFPEVKYDLYMTKVMRLI